MFKIACIGDSIISGFTLLIPRRDSYPSLTGKGTHRSEGGIP